MYREAKCLLANFTADESEFTLSKQQTSQAGINYLKLETI